MPDYFDRLVGRSLGAAATVDQPWVRPRLPQLFERPGPEATEFPAAAAAAPLTPVPVTAPAGVPPAGAGRDTLVDVRHTAVTVREKAFDLPSPGFPAPAGDASPVVAATERVERLVERQTVRPLTPAVVEHPVAEPRLDQPLTAQVVPPQAIDPRPAAAPAAPETVAAKADPQPAAPERVVRISIGRLAVTAAAPDRPDRGPDRPGRAKPRVSLDRYLGREEEPA